MAGRKTHGMTGTITYSSWAAMKKRTTSDPSKEYFANYGARGIKVCDRWADFKAFHADMGNRPSKLHSLGRIDNDKGYEPSNCKWQTRRKQQRDRRGSRKYETVRLIKELTGQDLTLRQVTHSALASIRTLPLKGRDARTPEDIIAAFMLWLDRNKLPGLKVLTQTKAAAPKRKFIPRLDQPLAQQITEPEPPLTGPTEPLQWELNVAGWERSQKGNHIARPSSDQDDEITF